MSDYLGKDVFKLGFGLMRLPKLPSGEIDVDQVCVMADKFILAGGTYFDTAYVYDDGESEDAVRKAVVDRYPRDKFTLCTKLNTRAPDCGCEADAKGQFYTSLERTGAGYFDYYLLHALQRGNRDLYDEYHIWDFVKEQKTKGLIKYFGFSFHGDVPLLEELLDEHPEVDFVQLQINYADWDNPVIASGRCYEIARERGKPITVMEPVKGGLLADPPDRVREIFDKSAPGASYASWGIRFAASLDGIITVLSGMSNTAQMEDNLSYMRDFKPLNEEEKLAVRKAQRALDEDGAIKCTACRYCAPGCPEDVAIPEIFSVRNELLRDPGWTQVKMRYAAATYGRGKASDCIECGQCEAACPQHLEVMSLLKECRSME